jgi:DNA-binding beta-propeller fold protein YncE
MAYYGRNVRCGVVTVLFALALLCGCSAPQVRQEPVFYPSLPEKPRLQFLTSISSEDDLTNKKPGLDDFIMGDKQSDESMGRPYAVHAVQGMIYLTDRGSNDLISINLATNKIVPLRAGGRGALQVPAGIWVTEEGEKFIADMKRRQVVVFDSNDRFLTALGDGTQLERPVDVAVHDERVYVCDIQKNQVLVFDRMTGRQIATIGKPGINDGELNRPSHLTLDKDGNLYVTEAMNFRVQKFSPDGRFLQRIGQAGNVLGTFARPKGLAVDRDNNLYVVDAAFENVQIFNPEAKLLLFFGGPGDTPGSMYLPAGIAIDYQNLAHFQKYADPRFRLRYLIYVCNMLGSNKLSVYGFGDWLDNPR